MLLMFVASLSLAAPPLPVWTAADVETFDPSDGSPNTTEVRVRMVDAVPLTRVLDPLPPGAHDWANTEDLTVAVSGELGSLYYLVATARSGALVAHWMHGPIAGEDQTTWVTLQAPPELAGPLEEVGVAHLTVAVEATTFDGTVLHRTALSRTALELRDGGIRRTAFVADRDETYDDAANPIPSQDEVSP